jgi:hypothetical protein
VGVRGRRKQEATAVEETTSAREVEEKRVRTRFLLLLPLEVPTCFPLDPILLYQEKGVPTRESE